MLTSEKITVSLHELDTMWSIDDFMDALIMLDAYDDLERRRAADLERKTKG